MFKESPLFKICEHDGFVMFFSNILGCIELFLYLCEKIVVKNLIRCGAIPLDQLEVGARYEGTCRNASEAVWNGKQFEYKRYKFGDWMYARINHFQEDDGNDLFVPIRKM